MSEFERLCYSIANTISDYRGGEKSGPGHVWEWVKQFDPSEQNFILYVTYQNCPNTCPLALWAEDNWYPLFPRKMNCQNK